MPSTEELIASLQTRIIEVERDLAGLKKGESYTALKAEHDKMKDLVEELRTRISKSADQKTPPPVTRATDPLLEMIGG